LKNNQVNQTITKKIVKAANGKETVFSMAFDEIAD
jgi:copper homeostasis protein CutC